MFTPPRPFIAVSLLAIALVLFAPTSRAHPQSDAAPASASSAPDPAKTLDTLSRQLDALKTTLNGKSISTDELRQLRGDATTLQQQAGQLADGLSPQIDGVKARLTVLGPPPAAGAPPETAQVTQQRKELQREQTKLDSEIKQAQLLGKDAATLTGQITQVRNYLFQTQLATRTGSPLSIGFWSDLAGDFPDDRQHLTELAQSFGAGVQQAWQPGNRMSFLLSLIGAILLLVFGRSLAERAALLLVINRMPDGRFRRSALAAMTTLSVTLSIGLAFWLLAQGLNWHGELDEDLAGLDQAVVRSAFFAAFLTGLCRSLLSVAHPSWRLPNVLDATAYALRWFPWLLGAGFLLLGTLEHINSAAETSLAMAVATRAVLALLISGVIGAALLRIKKLKRVASEGEHPAATHAAWVGALGALATLGVILAWASVLIGYVAFGFFVAYQMLWIGLIVASYYLLVNLQHDLFSTLLNPKGITGQRLQGSFGLPPHALEQASVLLSGISRVLLLLVAVGTLLMPFGGGPNDLFARIGNVFTDLKFGELSIQPAAIGQAIVVFVLGILAVRVVRRWLTEQLLPKTRLDQGMQMSIVTLLNYVAVVIVFALALKSAHVSLESLTWIASALSVGIGFGLQAIVSNFISGLILLAEQPVKVGDWVSMSGVEGDVKRINVRATEIQLWDRSTMIVPNSQFITQNVRNVTHGNALGRVKITLPMPLSTDVGKMRELMLDALGAHPATLETPAPYIRLDDVTAAGMMFSGVAYVSTPRDAGEVKSDILFDLLGRLDKAQMPLSTPTSMIVRNLGPSDTDGASL